MTNPDHVNSELLIRYLDSELGAFEAAKVRSHLATCEVCRERQSQFSELSKEIERFVNSVPVESPADRRSALAASLDQQSRAGVKSARPEKVLQRFGWGMAIAASLCLGLLLLPFDKKTSRPAVKSSAAKVQPTSFEINGESFLAVPYSNPDLPTSAPRIVEMQVPVASLAAAGIFLEPVANPGSDRTVFADVLLGLDGQPLGVHVLSTD